MRRRDPDAIMVADDRPTDKVRYQDRYGEDFAPLRKATLKWLGTQNLIVMPFYGRRQSGSWLSCSAHCT